MAELFKEKITPNNVLEIAKFDLNANNNQSPLDINQSEGVAGIYNILTEKNFAFLADEVGLGKTYQALALIAMVWKLKPDARIIVVCPKESLQTKWVDDYNYFIKKHYLLGDDIVKTSFLNEQVYHAIKIDRLNDFAKRLKYLTKDLIILRHSSFTRPIYIDDKNNNIDTAIQKAKLAGLNISNNGANSKELYLQYQYANSLNELLRTIVQNDNKPIDLLIFDESQYLRNPENQTNSIFKQVFFPEKDFENQFKEFNSDFINNKTEGIVNKWLFMSATPIHSSKLNVFKTLSMIGHEVKNQKELLDDSDKDSDKYKAFLKSFMIRRTRSYRFPNSDVVMNKHNYRKHDLDKSQITAMTPLHKLSLALVQKNLVKLLEGNSNKFKMGYLSSFESMSSSIINNTVQNQKGLNESDSQEMNNDFYSTEKFPKNEQVTIDSNFLNKIINDYNEKFNSKLPHPKIDDIVNKIWENYIKRGEKSLVFTRRISSTHEIESRLNKRWEEEIENRIKKVYKENNVWENIKKPNDDEGDDDDDTPDIENENTDEENEVIGAENYLSVVKEIDTNKKPGIIFKFRKTFNKRNSNDLIFEENYFRTLTKLKIINKKQIEEFINNSERKSDYERIYMESFDTTGKKLNNFQLYYKLLLCFLETLDDSKKKELVDLIKFIEHSKVNEEENTKVNFKEEKVKEKVEELIERTSFWESLPDDYSKLLTTKFEDLKGDNLEYREIVKEIISSQIRLTDLVIDLYYANEKKTKINDEGLKLFVNNMFADENDNYYSTFKKTLKSWFDEREVVEKYFINKESMLKEKGAENSLSISKIIKNLTQQQTIGNYQFALGVSGKTGVLKNLTKKFNSPGYPFAIITTDILKEGMDLHIFCKNMYHYGIAWTNGDMEQRNGRIDRNFSLFERELYKNDNKLDKKLNIYYPFISNTVEQHQIQRVIESIINSAKILDNIQEKKVNDSDESKEVDLNTIQLKSVDKLQKRLDLFSSNYNESNKGEFEPKFDNIESIKLEKQENKFKEKIEVLLKKIKEKAWEIDPNKDNLYNYSKNNVKLRLMFVGEISQYILQFEKEMPINEEPLNYSIDKFKSKDKIYYGQRIYLEENFNSDKIIKLIDFAENAINNPNSLDKQNDNIKRRVVDILNDDRFSMETAGILPEHALHFNVKLNVERSQKVKIYCYDNMLLISSKVAQINKFDISKIQQQHEKQITKDIIDNWIFKKNSFVDFGYFNYHKDYIRLSERYIIDTESIESNKEQFINFIITLARFADIYEYNLTGNDIN